jgi:hypothetical protein
MKCGQKCEVFSRIVGYYRPVELWNSGKKEEFRQRKMFSEKQALKGGFPGRKIAVPVAP